MAGLSPDLIVELAGNGVRFWLYQQDQHALLDRLQSASSVSDTQSRIRTLERTVLDREKTVDDLREELEDAISVLHDQERRLCETEELLAKKNMQIRRLQQQ